MCHKGKINYEEETHPHITNDRPIMCLEYPGLNKLD
jgi:hypothetical protein